MMKYDFNLKLVDYYCIGYNGNGVLLPLGDQRVKMFLACTRFAICILKNLSMKMVKGKWLYEKISRAKI